VDRGWCRQCHRAVEAFALLALAPLKTVVPYTLLVDRQTGYVQKLDPLQAGNISPDSALTQSFLVQYVIARESFDFATVQNDFRKVMLWSGEAAERDYAALMPMTNPASPLVTQPRGTVIEARVRSVSSLNQHTALVRFETVRRQRGGTVEPAAAWVAVVDYRYVSAPMTAEDRFTNPLGFEVVRYRRSAETPPLPAAEAPAGTVARDPALPESPLRQGQPSLGAPSRPVGTR
jgi:type IV secretion system protein VirB8